MQDLSERLDLEITYTKSMLQVLCAKNLVRKELHYRCPAVSVGACRPVPLPQPHGIAPDVPQDDVIFQNVALVRGDAAQAGFQAAEHVLPVEAAE